MKITCQACQAKYTIADEKVVGKIVKIRCKKCGASIVVNGNEPSAGSSQPPPAGAAFDYAGEGGAGAGWTVNVADGDQRTMTDAELVAAYRSGVVKDDTFCWKEGMADWLPIQEIPALLAACTSGGPVAAGAPATSRQSKPPARGDNGSPTGPASAALAARRAGRPAAADLFSGAAQAGGEDEVMTSAPAGVPQAHVDAPKPAARKDNNTLFGMGPDKAAAAAPSMTATTEASGLIDIRQLGAQMRASTEEKKTSRVDDIMNLGGGGGFSPSLAAPVLSAPSLEHYSKPPPGMPSEGAPPGTARSKALVFLALGAGTFFLVAAVGIAVVLVRGNGPSLGEDRERPSASASAAAASASPGASVAAASTGSASPTESPQGAAAPSAAASGEAPTAASSNAPPKEAAPKETKQAAAAAPAKEPTAAPAPASAEFNMGEARARLAAVASGVQSCKRGDTSGSGKVEIVFAPSGAVQSATLMGGSPFDGTPTGKCVEARFRQTRVPAFSGSPFSVSKSFSIN